MIEKGAAKNLYRLADNIQVGLGFNRISRLENGALGGLPRDACVHLAGNPIKVIHAGVFDDL